MNLLLNPHLAAAEHNAMFERGRLPLCEQRPPAQADLASNSLRVKGQRAEAVHAAPVWHLELKICRETRSQLNEQTMFAYSSNM